MNRFGRPLLFSAPLLIAGTVTFSYANRKLVKDFPDVPLENLPESSFTRRLVSESREHGLSPWEGEKDDRRLYTAYYSIYQATIPRRTLEAYGERLLQGSSSRMAYETASVTHALISSGMMRMERWISSTRPDAREAAGVFDPGQDIVKGILRVFSSDAAASSTSTLGHDPVLMPPCAVPDNVIASHAKGTGSTLLFWRTPSPLVQSFETAAAWGAPWRFMVGGWRELIVEEVLPSSTPGSPTSAAGAETGQEPLVRITLASTHVYDTLGKGDGKIVPRWMIKAHDTIAKAVLRSTLKQIEGR